MAKVTIEKRQFENDKGGIVNYNAIVIRGTINGAEQKIEKSLSNVEAMVAGMLLASTEKLEVQYGDNEGSSVKVNKKSSNKEPDFLDDLLAN